MDYTQFTPNPLKNKHPTLTERVKIELMLKDGKTAYAISKALECRIKNYHLPLKLRRKAKGSVIRLT